MKPSSTRTKERAVTAARSVTLQFDPAKDLLPSGARLSAGMSAATPIGSTLWLAHDESVSVERLQAAPTPAGALRYADHARFDLRDFIALPMPGGEAPDQPPSEVDLEGLAYCGDYLWVAGSHSVLRDGVEGAKGSAGIAALAQIKRAGNRFLLARIPVYSDGASPPMLVREWTRNDGRVLQAAQLAGGRKHNALTRALRDDPHLSPFLSIPSKDNGFDIEGLAAAPDGRLFLGLRGPLLDGWACILEIRVQAHPDRGHRLVLQKLATQATRSSPRALYRKHFLDLDGAGVRDLCLAGRDLMILTGPPMRGKGTAQVRCWKDALRTNGERLLAGKALPTLLEMRYRDKKDHPEGIAVVARKGSRIALLVINDAVDERHRGPSGALNAAMHELSLPGRGA